MTPPSMESIFLILSGVVLAAGVLYWLWSHIQLTQKKVQLLENAVFELRGMLTPPSGSGPSSVEEAPVYKDLEESDDEDWAPAAVAGGSTPLDLLQEQEETDESLKPGGGAGQGVVVSEVEEPDVSNEQFRELFLQRERIDTPVVKDSVSTTPSNESLESMPVKELRRLAEQRGITGVSELKKKELLSALRQQITVATPPSNKEVTVERTLDLVEETAEETNTEMADVPTLE
jgi:hypothetical protein